MTEKRSKSLWLIILFIVIVVVLYSIIRFALMLFLTKILPLMIAIFVGLLIIGALKKRGRKE